MVKIIHLISGLFVGGAETTLYKLISRMNVTHFQNMVVCLIEIGPVGDDIRCLGVPVYSLGMHRSRPSPLGLLRLVRLLKGERPDILQTWLYHADLLGLAAGKLARAPVTVWNLRASNMDMSQYRRLSGWTLEACAHLSRWPEAVVVNSEAGRLSHAQIGYSPRHWVLIPNGIDLQQFKPDLAARLDVRRELGLAPETLLIGLVARFDPMKDHVTFLRAAGQLAQIEPLVHFVLAGDGVTPDNQFLSDQIAQADLTRRVHLLGRRLDVPRLTAALDIASSSSYSEGFPNVVGEAMACGVPCVVTDVGDSAKIVGNTGIVIPAKDPQRLAEGWRKMIEMGAEGRQELGRAAREWIERNYSLDRVVQQYENLYLSLVERQRSRAS